MILVNKIDLVSEDKKAKLLEIIRYVQHADFHPSSIYLDPSISLLKSTKLPVHGMDSSSHLLQ